jgi:hypothetical protein
MSISVSVSGADRSLRFDWPAASKAWAADIRPAATTMMKLMAPVGAGPGGGALRQGISSRLEPAPAQMSVIIYGTASYLPYVLGGTRPHLIAARNAKALRWIPNRGHGSPLFARSVNYPRTKPDNFPERAITSLGTLILQSLIDAVKEATIVD